jgi:hypothetical protein
LVGHAAQAGWIGNQHCYVRRKTQTVEVVI